MKKISIKELKAIRNREALVIQGCGGELQEWIDGINDYLTDEGILLDGDKFGEILCFENDGITNLAFMLDDVKIDTGKLAIWRIKTHRSLGGTWLSDYLPNCFGIEYDSKNEEEGAGAPKPDCPLIGQDGNIFNLLGIASRTLQRNGMKEAASEMSGRAMKSGSYDEALAIIGEYVNITASAGHEDTATGEEFCAEMEM
jgi:hypothetical protein